MVTESFISSPWTQRLRTHHRANRCVPGCQYTGSNKCVFSWRWNACYCLNIPLWVVSSETNSVVCLQAKAPDAKLMTIREDAEELESALNKLDQQASYCLIYARIPVVALGQNVCVEIKSEDYHSFSVRCCVRQLCMMICTQTHTNTHSSFSCTSGLTSAGHYAHLQMIFTYLLTYEQLLQFTVCLALYFILFLCCCLA